MTTDQPEPQRRVPLWVHMFGVSPTRRPSAALDTLSTICWGLLVGGLACWYLYTLIFPILVKSGWYPSGWHVLDWLNG